MPPWDLFVLDLDGTLLGPEGSVSDANQQALAHLRATCVDVLIATGRTRNETIGILDSIDYRGRMIGSGGAILVDGETGRTIHRHPIERSLVREAVEHLHQEGHTALVLKDHEAAGYDYLLVGSPFAEADPELHPVSSWWMESMGVECRWIEDIDDDPHPDDSLRVSSVGESNILAPTTARVRTALGTRMELQQWAAVTSSHATGSDVHILELFAGGVDKWSMIEFYCEQHGHDPARVVAIGDGLNDVGMIRSAGLGIAMANADDAVLAVADEVTGHHGQDGVASAIHRLVPSRADGASS
ncbi:MAG: HAD family hydrolase [Phycisphaerales bacterium]|nr:HAD family hydrolase [Phycisphaerales bacterium]